MRISPRIRHAMNPSEVLLETRVTGSTVTIVRYAPFQEIRPHAHAEEGLTIVLSGTFLEEAQRGTMLANAGSVATRPYGLRHTNRFGPQGAVILAVIPDREHWANFKRSLRNLSIGGLLSIFLWPLRSRSPPAV